ncbi:hypothetical protein BC943DRAFT_360107 [Umbelopsis sp. AD052]|nr:hypothetical protein BC943DRAFT_360107 [Umbelopsis sp. AD052]
MLVDNIDNKSPSRGSWIGADGMEYPTICGSAFSEEAPGANVAPHSGLSGGSQWFSNARVVKLQEARKLGTSSVLFNTSTLHTHLSSLETPMLIILAVLLHLGQVQEARLNRYQNQVVNFKQNALEAHLSSLATPIHIISAAFLHLGKVQEANSQHNHVQVVH